MAANRKYAKVKLLQQKVLLAQQEVERAIAQLANVRPILESVCQYIHDSLNFDFVAISLISPENQTIETVCGTGIAAKWSNQCRHYLESNPLIRDIQADIVFTHHTEIIRGEDKRFDPWIYQRYEHKNLIRIFTPILLIKDKYGNIRQDWFDPSQLNVISNITNEAGSRIVLSSSIPPDSKFVQVIGTVEAGYFLTNKQSENILSQSTISLERAEDFVGLVASKTKEIYYPLLAHALDVITHQIRDVLGANAVSIKLFTHHRDWQSVIRETSIGYIDYQRYGVDLEAEKKYLGERVLRKDEPHLRCYPAVVYESNTDENYNFIASKLPEDSTNLDTLTIAVFPYHFEGMQGLIFIECVGTSPLVQKKNGWLNLYLQRTVHSIWYATTYAKQNVQTSQLTNLHGFTESLTQVSESNELFSQIAWETLHILAADIVVIYEYSQKQKQFMIPPDIAGRLIYPERMKTELSGDKVTQKLIDGGTNVYTSELTTNSVFQNSSFSQREHVQSAAGILLKIADEIVGVMFINYRREHRFSETQKKLIETLASSAAIAIQNQRWFGSWLEALNDIDLKIITATKEEELLNQIVERAAHATNADFAAIRIVDKGSYSLETRAIYPHDGVRTSGQPLSSFDEGITGWVAKNRKPQRVDDVSQDQRYRAFFPDVGSELCVPLIDKNSHLLGVLNVESHRIKSFNPRDLKMLQMVAGLAVIAIQNFQTKKLLAKAERMATLGDFAAPLVHRINNKVGAIRVLAQDILEMAKSANTQIHQEISSVTETIIHNAETALKQAQFIQNWKVKPQDKEWISLNKILEAAISHTRIPPKIICHLDISPELPQVNCVKIQLSEAFDVLIQNAIDAMPKGGELLISAQYIESDLGCWLETIVKDTGIGIEPQNRQRIFEPGFTSKGEGNGHMGFALWWLQSYIEDLGGEVKVQSQVGEGSEFKVILPVQR